jgi:hypothetical protein
MGGDREAPMKTLALMLAFVASTSSAMAQSVPTEKEALKDAEYVLRRFDELTANIDFNRWQARGNLVGQAQDGVTLVQTMYVSDAKIILTGIEGARKAKPVELLDIMSDLERVGTELTFLSDLVFNYQDPDTQDMTKVAERSTLAADLNKAGTNAQTAMTKVYVVLRQKMVAEGETLEKCAQARSPKKANASK